MTAPLARGRPRPETAYAALAAAALAAIAAGLVVNAAGHPDAAHVIWGATIAGVGLPLVGSVIAALAGGRVGVDIIALIAMAAAPALGEWLAGAIVALMLVGGNAIEAVAGRRARRELTALLSRAPTVAHRRRGDRLEEVPVAALVPGDLVVVRDGEIVPVDGIVASDSAVVDESALTGEALPATYARGAAVRSGVANAGVPFDVRASRPADESAYAGIVRLVARAQADRAPFARMADRYAALLLPVTLVAAGGAWAASGDADRALAVVVVATPCPLILAAPIALVCGVSRAARRGIIVKGASVIEALGRVRSVLLDKTGTLTLGTPQVQRIDTVGGVDPAELLRDAASLDQLSTHVLAEALVHEAQSRGLELAFPEQVLEAPGEGIAGVVSGRRVAVGSARFLRDGGGVAGTLPGEGDVREAEQGLAKIGVGIDGRAAGVIVMADRVRPDAASLVAELREGRVRHLAMVSGDRQSVAEAVGAQLGLDRVYSERSPEDKLEVVRAVHARPGLAPVLMVGDGVNDAPALALADVGIAMGTAGATASSDAADAVITTSAIGTVAEALGIGRRSLRIATQSVVAGMAMSFIAMGFAAAGALSPVAGALLQEGIDVAVILNALRALRA